MAAIHWDVINEVMRLQQQYGLPMMDIYQYQDFRRKCLAAILDQYGRPIAATEEKAENRAKCVYPVIDAGSKETKQCGSEESLHTVKGKDEGIVCAKHRIDAVRSWDWSEIEPYKHG